MHEHVAIAGAGSCPTRIQISRKGIYWAIKSVPQIRGYDIARIMVSVGISESRRGCPRGYEEITLFRNGEDKLEQLERKRYLPAEKYPYLLLRFYDTYTYYIYLKNLLSLCSGSPAPWIYYNTNDNNLRERKQRCCIRLGENYLLRQKDPTSVRGSVCLVAGIRYRSRKRIDYLHR